MKFCTVINCMDGRTQQPVIAYLQKRFNAEYVDTITEPGPNRILAEQNNAQVVDNILARVNISVNKHHSTGIAIVGHHDCAGNPSSYKEQLDHIKKAKNFIKQKYGDIEVIGLWVNEEWKVQEI